MKFSSTKNPNLVNVLTTLFNAKLHGNLSKKVLNIASSFDVAENLFNSKHNEVISKYYKRDEKGEPIKNGDKILLDDTKTEEMNKALSALSEEQAAVPALSTADLDGIPGGVVSAADIKTLYDHGLVVNSNK